MANWNWNCYSCIHNKGLISPCNKEQCEFFPYCISYDNKTGTYITENGTSVDGYKSPYDGIGNSTGICNDNAIDSTGICNGNFY